MTLLPYILGLAIVSLLIGAIIHLAGGRAKAEERGRQAARTLEAVAEAKKIRERLDNDPEFRAELDKKYQRD